MGVHRNEKFIVKIFSVKMCDLLRLMSYAFLYTTYIVKAYNCLIRSKNDITRFLFIV